MKQSLGLLQLDYRRARKTDRQISYGTQLFWMILSGAIIWLPVYTILVFKLPVLAMIADNTDLLIASYFLGLLVSGWWWHVITFKLVDRHLQHMDRKGKFFEDIVDYVKEEAADRNAEEGVGQKIYSLEILVTQYYKSLKRRHPGTWTIIGIFSCGISTYYTAYFLMNDLQKMQQIEDDFLQILSEILASLNVIKYPITYEKEIPIREYGIFAAIAIFTLGLFWFYWWYVLVTDPNTYYENSERWESQLIFTLFYAK
jgi:hypothetical protein